MSLTARAAEERAAALEAAMRLLALAMGESHAPVGVLASALERMAVALARCSSALGQRRGARSVSEVPPDDAALGDVEQACEALERDIALCIESLQFHDRLMQRLERVHACLAGAPGKRCVHEAPPRTAASEGSIELFE